MTHDLVDLGELVADGRLRPQRADPVALRAVLDAAKDDLVAAAAVVTTSPSWAETMLYEAGLRTARVIVQAAGFRIAADRGHVTAIDAADALMDGVHHRPFVRLHRMRRMRHRLGRFQTPSVLCRVDHEAALAASAWRSTARDDR